MVFRNSNVASICLAALSAACVSLLCWYSYRTGCAADLKTGSWGNIELALHYSQVSFVWLVLALLVGILAIVALPGRDAPTRAAMATVFFFAGGLAFWLLDHHFEVMGLQACSAA